ncbi:chemotaxis protein CheW [Fluviispira sanaruensis]|uniref:Chemotaxis protein CheW n=1 Tax=Fluviispira sanaruensis TaxID=2493639 RepID=A0A4P2VMI4_FLUSA|nr:chemotaxis protein CheW [Fluviispira sanaruensis]BBH53978.1 chemotaxis protein CheW [Fluviispira sanaruensis]
MIQENDNQNLFLVFHLNNEIYGTNLMQVREVIERQTPKPVPNTIQSYLGVINVRGEIIGAIDLRLRFGYPSLGTPANNSAMIVINLPSGTLAVITDQLEGVFHLNFLENGQKPKIESSIRNDYILGMCEFKNKIITIIDLYSILNTQEITSLNQIHNESKEAI